MTKQKIKVKKRKKESEGRKERKVDERFFAVTDIDSGVSRLILITPNLRYNIASDGRIVKTESVRNYNEEVTQEVDRIRERALVGDGFYSDKYRIQFNHPGN